jgi:hypothetical protein
MTRGNRALAAVLVAFMVFVFGTQVMDTWIGAWLVAIPAGFVLWLLTEPHPDTSMNKLDEYHGRPE